MTIKVTTKTIRQLKGKRPIVALTAYDSITANLASEAGVDLILIGDSVGTTLLGFDSTTSVTLEMIVHHTAAVARSNPKSLIVSDVPFIEASFSTDKILRSCQKIMQRGNANAVKIEGGKTIAPKIAELVLAGIPVLGHIGLLPQHYHVLGGYKSFGKTPKEETQLLEDAKALEDAGCFSIVCEMVKPEITAKIAKSIDIPLIGIGSGNGCDGQILVSTDILGMDPSSKPKFAHQYANVGEITKDAFKQYVAAVLENKSTS